MIVLKKKMLFEEFLNLVEVYACTVLYSELWKKNIDNDGVMIIIVINEL